VRPWVLLCLAVVLGTECKSKPESAAAAADPPKKGNVPVLAPSARPYGLYVPAGLDRSRPEPLVVFFHGYGAAGANAARSFGMTGAADAHGFVLAYPDGTVDAQGNRFWNANSTCCNFDNTSVDDVAYTAWLIDDVASKANIDRKRVYVMGHSNGGFLALRLACDLAPRVAAAVSLAGAAWKDPSKCNPSEPVSVLQIHGDADQTVRYGGGLLFDKPGHEYPGAETTVATWASKDHCTGAPAPVAGTFDFDGAIPGPEASRKQATGCPPGIGVDLWTVAGAPHQLNPSAAGLDAMWAWMAAHPKR
jgi:polyhydroxybutyrate depolymerase